MNNLFGYITSMIKEDNRFPTPEDGVRYIKVCLNYLGKEDLDEVGRLIQKKMGNRDIEGNANTFRSNLAERLDNQKINYFRKEIEHALNKGGDYETMANYYRSGSFIEIEDIFRSNDVLKFISEHTGLAERTIELLYNISGGGRPAIGKGEILLDLICNNIDKSGKGDVVFKDGRNFEIKGLGGAVLYEQMWKDKDLSELWDAFWGEQKNTKTKLDRPSANSNFVKTEFEELLVKKTGIKNYDSLNKVWGSYIIWKYATTEEFTDLLIGDYLKPGKFFWIPGTNKSPKFIYNTIKDLPLRFEWPSIPGATGGSQRCAVK